MITRALPGLHDRVRYTAQFLQSAGMYTEGDGAFRKGVIVGDHPSIKRLVMVHWDYAEAPMAVPHAILIEENGPDYTGR